MHCPSTPLRRAATLAAVGICVAVQQGAAAGPVRVVVAVKQGSLSGTVANVSTALDEFSLSATDETRAAVSAAAADAGEAASRFDFGGREGPAGAAPLAVASFKGIPFAQPPVGEGRFAPPRVPPASWDGDRDASVFASGCISVCEMPGTAASLFCAATTSEDCLYLNVYTPAHALPASGEKPEHGRLPVFIFLHGGAYSWGSASAAAYDGAVLARTMNAVVVTSNYRLGALGALYTRPGSAEGNFMLQDQRAALRWVRDNIARFGGDSRRVTIGGQSAGAYSAQTHFASPQSAGLFKRALLMSSPAAIPSPTPKQAGALGADFLKAVSCDGRTSPDEELTCLRGVAVDKILTAQGSVSHGLLQVVMNFLKWAPVVATGSEVPLQPAAAMEANAAAGYGLRDGRSGAYIPTLSTTVADEGTLYRAAFKTFGFSRASLKLVFSSILGVKGPQIIAAAYGELPADTDTAALIQYADNVTTDYIFACPAQRGARGASLAAAAALAKAAKSFIAVMGHVTKRSGLFFRDPDGKPLPCATRVCHGSDLAGLFFALQEKKLPGIELALTVAERRSAALQQGALANFVHTGDVNPLPAGAAPLGSALGQTLSQAPTLVITADGGAVHSGYGATGCVAFESPATAWEDPAAANSTGPGDGPWNGRVSLAATSSVEPSISPIANSMGRADAPSNGRVSLGATSSVEPSTANSMAPADGPSNSGMLLEATAAVTLLTAAAIM